MGVWCLSEKHTQLLVNGVLAILLLCFTVFAIIRLEYSVTHPVQQVSTEKKDSIATPGFVICPDFTFLNQTLYGWTCDVRRPGLPESESPHCPISTVTHAWKQLVTTGNRCLKIDPGLDMKSPRDLVQVDMYVGQLHYPTLDAQTFLSVGFNQIYFGIYNTEADLPNSHINLALAGGTNLIDLKKEEHVSVSGDVTTQYVLGNTMGTPQVGHIYNQSANPYEALTRVNFYFLFSRIEVQRTTDVIAFNAGDLLSAIGGVFSILAFIAAKLNGEGQYDPYGLIHQLWYPPKQD